MARISSFFLLLTLLSGICVGQTSTAFTYNSFLQTVRENNPLAKKADNTASFGEFNRRAAQGNFDPQLTSSWDNKHYNGVNYFASGGAELKQALYTSHYLKAGYQYGQGFYLDPEKYTPTIGLPYLGLEAALLQGFRIDKRRADVIKARHYSDYFNAEQKIQINDLMFFSSIVYLEALYNKRINKLYHYFASLADQRLRGINDLAIKGERAATDTVEAAILLQGRLLDKQAGEIELTKKINDLLFLSNANRVLSAQNLNLSDSLEQLYFLTLKNMPQSAGVDQTTNPLVTQYQAKQQILETEKKLKREMIKPVLNLSYNFLNTSSSPVLPAFNTYNYKWGATFSLPLFLRKPRHEYKMASLDAENNELEVLNKQNQLTFKRKYIFEAIRIMMEQVANAERSVAYSRLLVDAEKLKFANGESSLFLLNARENKWLEMELKLAEYRLKFMKSMIELTYVNGDLRYEVD